MIGTYAPIGTYATGLLNAILVCITAFGLNLSTNQVGAIQGVFNAFILLIAALWHLRQINQNKNGNGSGNGVKIAASRSTLEQK